MLTDHLKACSENSNSLILDGPVKRSYLYQCHHLKISRKSPDLWTFRLTHKVSVTPNSNCTELVYNNSFLLQAKSLCLGSSFVTTCKFIVHCLHFSVKCIGFAQGLNEKWRKSLQSSTQMSRTDIEMIVCKLLQTKITMWRRIQNLKVYLVIFRKRCLACSNMWNSLRFFFSCWRSFKNKLLQLQDLKGRDSSSALAWWCTGLLELLEHAHSNVNKCWILQCRLHFCRTSVNEQNLGSVHGYYDCCTNHFTIDLSKRFCKLRTYHLCESVWCASMAG